jgi:predicted ABC-type ATPase
MSPIGFLFCGPSGVGKNTHFKTMLKNAGIEKELLLIDPDKRKEEIHKERSELAYEEVKEAITKKKDFGYFSSCVGFKRIYEMVSEMQQNNYRIIVAIVYTSLPVALERTRKRMNQLVPDIVVEDLHAFFKTKAERFMNLPVEIYLYNNETDFNLLLSKKKKKIVCRDGNTDFYFDISRYCS